MKKPENDNSFNSQILCNTLTDYKWQSMPQNPVFSSDKVCVYAIKVSEFISYLPIMEGYLNNNELLISEKFHRLSDKQSYIISRSILKLLISKLIDKHPNDIEIGLGINKKPGLERYGSIKFNLSHSHDMIALIISDNEVGIDLERIMDEFSFEDILEFSFSEKEKQYIVNSESKTMHFYELWTRKEALAKATSKGIDDDFHLIPSLTGTHTVRSNIIGSHQNWSVSTVLSNHEYMVSIAYNSDKVTDLLLYNLDSNLLFL